MARYIYYIIGAVFLALGVTLTLMSDLGAGGWDALTENLYKITGISIGTWIIIVALSLLVMAAILKKEFINYRVFIMSIILGKLVDLFYFTLEPLKSIDSYLIRTLILVTGLLLIGIGSALVFVTKLPKNHTEEFVFAVLDIHGLSYQKAKTTVDIVALLIALSLGVYLKDFSNIGIGTILNSGFMGTIVHICMPHTIRFMNKFSKETFVE